ncbi:MAG: hypothetical protein KAX24_01880 [Anaerolineae bacterium]|nr:hypothetical protein [Anaerolineae bacterium]
MNDFKTDEGIKEAVRQTYGDIARRFVEEPVLSNGLSQSKGAVEGPARASCCGPNQPTNCCGPSEAVADSTSTAVMLYSAGELADLPDSVTGIALGCGNPTAITELRPGEAVLDLGSGGGIDCFLAELPQSIRDRLDAWAGCIAGGLDESDYLSKIRAVGFEEAKVLSRDYVKIGETAGWEDVQSLLSELGLSPRDLAHTVASIKVRARKPA